MCTYLKPLPAGNPLPTIGRKEGRKEVRKCISNSKRNASKSGNAGTNNKLDFKTAQAKTGRQAGQQERDKEPRKQGRTCIGKGSEEKRNNRASTAGTKARQQGSARDSRPNTHTITQSERLSPIYLYAYTYIARGSRLYTYLHIYMRVWARGLPERTEPSNADVCF